MLYYGNESDEVERTTELIPVKAVSPIPRSCHKNTLSPDRIKGEKIGG